MRTYEHKGVNIMMSYLKKIFGFTRENQSHNLQIVADNFRDTISQGILDGKAIEDALWQFENISHDEDKTVRGEKDYAGFDISASVSPLENAYYEVVVMITNNDDTIIEVSGNIIHNG